MHANPPATPTPGGVKAPAPTNVRRTVAQLDALPDATFNKVVADVVMASDPDVDVQAALRTPALVAKSLAATRFHIDRVNARLQRREGESAKDWRRRQDHFRDRMGQERRLLESVRQGVLAQRGVVPNRPNPRQWALEQMKESHITVHCDCGVTHRVPLYATFRRLLEGRKAELKRQQKASRRAAKRARR